MIVILLILTFCLLTTRVIPYKHSGPKFIALSLPTLLCVWLTLAYWWGFIPMLVWVSFITFYKRATCTTVLYAALVILFAVVCITPGMRQEVYLQLKYPDSFAYMSADKYMSDRSQQLVTVNSTGDDYQSIYYSKRLIRECVGMLPYSNRPDVTTMEKQVSSTLYLSYDNFVQDVQPKVHLWLHLPTQAAIKFPTLVEIEKG